MVYTSASIIAGAHDDVVVAGNTVKFWLSAARIVAKEVERLLNNRWGIRLLLLNANGQPRDFAAFIFEYKNGYTTWSVEVSLKKGKPAVVVIPDNITTTDVAIWADIGKFLENFEYIKDFVEYTVGA